MNRSLVIPGTAFAAVAVAMGVPHKPSLDGRIAALEERALHAEDSVTADEVERLERELAAARDALREQRKALLELGSIAQKADRIEEIEEGTETRWSGLVSALEATTHLVEETRDELGRVESRLERDASVQWKSMVGPTVQLSGETTVGSGVLLPSRPVENEGFETLLLTSWHVVRDIRADSPDADCPVPVIVRDVEGVKSHYTASLLAHDVALDAALLMLDTNERLPVAAQLPSRKRLTESRVLDSIVAVGCPLGNDPIPTRGHLSDLYHEIDGERFWMISAPTYIGNSGGGLYSGDSHELIGIFSKIYTHGAIRPTIIPHMGLVTPLEEFYDWIDEGKVARVIETEHGAAVIRRR